jgi:hypothetical protein
MIQPTPPAGGPDRELNAGVFSFDGQGNLTCELDNVRAVGIASLAEVRRHDIVPVAGLVSHHLWLHGGGEVRFAYNNRGQIIELSADKVSVQLTPDRQLVFSSLTT